MNAGRTGQDGVHPLKVPRGLPSGGIINTLEHSTIGHKAQWRIKDQYHPKSVFNLGPKVGPGLNKKPDFQEVFYSGFPLPNGKQQNPKGRRAKRAAPLGRRRRRRLVVFHLAVETQNKKPHGNQFFIKVRPNFWPQIDNRLWVVLALNKREYVAVGV